MDLFLASGFQRDMAFFWAKPVALAHGRRTTVGIMCHFAGLEPRPASASRAAFQKYESA
jgi:hypothetical protein